MQYAVFIADVPVAHNKVLIALSGLVNTKLAAEFCGAIEGIVISMLWPRFCRGKGLYLIALAQTAGEMIKSMASHQHWDGAVAFLMSVGKL